MPISYQEPAPGGKSAKFITANPLDPFLRPFETNDAHDDDPQRMLADAVNDRLTKAMIELKVKHATGTNELDDPDRAPTGSGYHQTQTSQMPQIAQQQQLQKSAVTPDSNNTRKENGCANDDSDDEFDWLLEEDAEALDVLREKRLAELKHQAEQKAENVARGHGQMRTISQDEFLPECTGTSEWTVVHFFHREFQRCTVMDHHLKIVAHEHHETKFLRIDAEKAPFFVQKLNIQTLPTVLMLQNGKVVDTLVGFEGLASVVAKPRQQYGRRNFEKEQTLDPDVWETCALKARLATSGAIDYSGETTDKEEPEVRRQRLKGCISRGGTGKFQDDDY